MVGAGDAAGGRSVVQGLSAGGHGDLDVRNNMSWKWTDAVRAEGVDSTDR